MRILGKFCAEVFEYKTSRDLTTDGPIFTNLESKDA